MTHCLKNNLHIQLFCEEGLVSYYKKMGFENFAICMRKSSSINEQISYWSKTTWLAIPWTYNSVWFGAGVIVLPGINIGDDVVIGSRSIVTEDIPSGVIAVRSSCKVIRKITEEDKKGTGRINGKETAYYDWRSKPYYFYC